MARSHQRTGIGKRLIEETRAALGAGYMIVLLAAPASGEYYPHIGFGETSGAWVLPADRELR